MILLKKCLHNLNQKNEMQSVAGLASHPSWTAARSWYTKEIIACMVISVVDTRHPLKLLYSKDSKFQPPRSCLRSQVHRLARVGSLISHLQPHCQVFILGLDFSSLFGRRVETHLWSCALSYFLLSLGHCFVILDYSSLPTLSIFLTSMLGSHLS